MKLLSSMRTLSIVVIVSPLWAMDYQALRMAAKTRNADPSSTPVRLVKCMSPLLRLCDQLAAGVQPCSILELRDDNALEEYVAELFGTRIFNDEKNSARVMKAAYVLTDAFIEKRKKKRAEYSYYTQLCEKILVEIYKLQEEMKELAQEIAAMTSLHKTQNANLQHVDQEQVCAQKKASEKKSRKLPEFLTTADEKRSVSCTALKATSERLIASITEKIRLYTEELEAKKAYHGRLMLERDVRIGLADQALISLAKWDEGLIKMGLTFKGAVSTSLIVDLIEEHLDIKKLYDIGISFKDEDKISELDKIKNDIEVIKRKTGTCIIC